jgi:hypothetical protein
MNRTIRTKNEIIIMGNVATMFLYDINQEVVGKTVFNKCHVDTVKEYKWYLSKTGYVKSGNGVQQPRLTLHRLILEVEDSDNLEVDHIDRNPLNNLDENLRLCSHKENTYNMSKRKNNISGVTGVRWDYDREKWCSQIMVDKKYIFLGRHEDKDDAIKRRLVAEKKYFGEFAPQKHLFEEYGV